MWTRIKNEKISTKENYSSSLQFNILPNITKNINDILEQKGSPLDTLTREYIKSRFGYDFSNVRIHDDIRSALLTEFIDAVAFTHGSLIRICLHMNWHM